MSEIILRSEIEEVLDAYILERLYEKEIPGCELDDIKECSFYEATIESLDRYIRVLGWMNVDTFEMEKKNGKEI